MKPGRPPQTTEPAPAQTPDPSGTRLRSPHGPWFHAFFALLALVSAVLLGVLAWQRPGWVDSPLVGKSAPRVRGTDTQGRLFDTRDGRGRVVVLGFAAMDCKPSVDAMSAWGAVRAAMPDADRVCVAAVCLRGSRAQVDRFMRQAASPFPVLLDADRSVIEAYRVGGLPRTVLIRADGRVGRVYEGYHPNMVDRIVAEVGRLGTSPGAASARGH